MKYLTFKLNDSEPLFPQTWNRIWFFWDLGFKSYKDLENYSTNVSAICTYKPILQDALAQDVFREGNGTIVVKYIVIRSFCLQKLNESEKEWLRPHSARVRTEEMNKLYKHLLEN